MNPYYFRARHSFYLPSSIPRIVTVCQISFEIFPKHLNSQTIERQIPQNKLDCKILVICSANCTKNNHTITYLRKLENPNFSNFCFVFLSKQAQTFHPFSFYPFSPLDCLSSRIFKVKIQLIKKAKCNSVL